MSHLSYCNLIIAVGDNVKFSESLCFIQRERKLVVATTTERPVMLSVGGGWRYINT